jgi:hypothetical protein
VGLDGENHSGRLLIQGNLFQQLVSDADSNPT